MITRNSLQKVCETVIFDRPYDAPLRDPNDLHVMQTAEPADADVLCRNDADFHNAAMIAFCAARGIEVSHEAALLARLVA